MNASDEITTQLGKEQGEKKDSILGFAIKTALGSVDVLSVVSRLQCLKSGRENDGSIWLLDGRRLVQFWPIEVKTVHEGHKCEIVATMPYKTFDWKKEKPLTPYA